MTTDRKILEQRKAARFKYLWDGTLQRYQKVEKGKGGMHHGYVKKPPKGAEIIRE